jgi:hypothetical protein
MPDPKDEFREVRQGHLAARIYKSGHVVFGAMLQFHDDKSRVEVEVSATLKDAREFFDKVVGAINVAEGRYT